MEKALSLALVQDQPAQFKNILTTESRFLRCNCKLAGKTYELYLFHRLQASQGHVTYLIPKLCEITENALCDCVNTSENTW